MKTKWRLDRHVDNDELVIRETETDAIIANLECDTQRDFSMTEEEHKANILRDGTLMVAAPELLAAAKSCQSMADKCNNAMLPNSVQELLKAIETTLSEAIKKATA